MTVVADRLHGLGLLFGMYSSAGEMTCARYGKRRFSLLDPFALFFFFFLFFLWLICSPFVFWESELPVLTSFIAGSLDYEKEDAESFASWEVDYLKYDNCYHLGRFGTPLVTFNRFKAMADALKATGRQILYSLCNWGEDYVHTVSTTHTHPGRSSCQLTPFLDSGGVH